jgi:hypothetical protein
MLFNPLGVPVAGYFLQGVWGIDACTGNQVDMTGWFPTWGTDNAAIATANMNNIHGVTAGSTRNYAQGDITWGTGQQTRHCPIRADNPGGGTDVGPYQVEPIDTALQGPAVCPSGQAGWARNVTNQLQYQSGSPYAVPGVTVADTISVGSTNQLGLSGPWTGQTTTTGDGSFPDTYTVCSVACPASTGYSNALQ